MELGPIFRSLFHHKSRFWLIVLEIGLTLAVVANCVHMILDHRHTISRTTGIDVDNILVVESDPFAPEFQDESYVRAGIGEDLRKLNAVPGVISAIAINQVPLSNSGSAVARRPEGTEGEFVTVPFFDVTEGALQALGVELVAGRDFVASDFPDVGKVNELSPDETETRNVILTRELADAIFPDGDALGQTIENQDGNEFDTVVGIIESMHCSWPMSSVVERTLLAPGLPGDSRRTRFLVRAKPGELDALYTSLETVLLDLDAGRLVRVRSLHEVKAATYGNLDATIRILVGVCVLLILVTSLGIIGLTSFSVANRTHEIGTRRALGATRISIVRYFLVENWLITTFGLSLGVILTYALSYGLTEFADIPRIGWPVVAFGMLGLWIAGLAAALTPAVRGAAVPPVVATRTVSGLIPRIMSCNRLKVLTIDDEPAVVHALGVLFEIHNIPFLGAGSPDEAMERLAGGEIGVVVQDMNFGPDKTSGEEGIRLFRRIRETHPGLPVLLITAWASLETAVQLIKEGANDYLAKPWDDDKLVAAVKNLLEMRRLQMENERLRREGREAREALAAEHDMCGVVFESGAMLRVVTLALNVSRSDAPVLITGPSGCGKEKLAEIVQANSRRRRGPFLRVNVGALPEELMESELFGAEAGAYTGATRRREGRFEAADGGTLFLDEIDALSLAGQVKLLRVLQSGEFQRLGNSATRRADVRLISATNSDLVRAVAGGRFREDLYYRLNVIELAVPPLQERPEDLLPLARHFLDSQAAGGEGEPPDLDREAREAVLRHRWPGNVRELENRIQRATLTCRGGTITTDDLALDEVVVTSAGAIPATAADPAEGPGPLDAERSRIERALIDAEGVVARAAERLGMSRQALYRRMEKLGIVLERRPRP